MPSKRKDPAIYIGDTVHTISADGTENRARWTVEEIHADTDTALISRVSKPDFRTTRYQDRPFPTARIALVRHGNALDDDLRRLREPTSQKPHHSDRTQSPYILDGHAHRPNTLVTTADSIAPEGGSLDDPHRSPHPPV
ncbi:hypothetical protein [Nocardia sp. NBC_01327]|uniref:hypothetical protein n=1 Tax=Nocardia sp. NBC_01327 TaxID=2903593 RepID=UPI002E0DC562|nr:hypothetical protein OG326_42435 [Nocardia sp. NBC_01327]